MAQHWLLGGLLRPQQTDELPVQVAQTGRIQHALEVVVAHGHGAEAGGVVAVPREALEQLEDGEGLGAHGVVVAEGEGAQLAGGAALALARAGGVEGGVKG